MNYTRIFLAALAATFVDAIYGFVMYGNLLTSQFALFPGVYRSMDTQTTYMPFLFGGIFIAMLGASTIYAKGYEGGSGLAEGLRFGVLIGAVTVGYSVFVGYAIMNIGKRLAVSMTAATFLEWVLAAVVIGLVYKPKAS